jgi:hypothetical protein
MKKEVNVTMTVTKSLNRNIDFPKTKIANA